MQRVTVSWFIQKCIGETANIIKNKFDVLILEEPSKVIPDMSGKTSGKTPAKILSLIETNMFITIPELTATIGISERSIERNIQKLHIEKKLRREGPAKGGYWKLLRNDQN